MKWENRSLERKIRILNVVLFLIWEYIPRRGIAGTYSRSNFNFLRELHIVSIVAEPIYIPPNSVQTLSLVFLTCDPAIPHLGIYPKEMKTGYWRHMCTAMFIAALSIIAKIWKQPKCSSTDEWIKKVDICIQWTIISHWKEGNSAICNYMDRPWGPYAKWDKSDKERQILGDITYMWNLKKPAH